MDPNELFLLPGNKHHNTASTVPPPLPGASNPAPPPPPASSSVMSSSSSSSASAAPPPPPPPAAPLLRPPIPGARNDGRSPSRGPPKLTLGIPQPQNSRPVSPHNYRTDGLAPLAATATTAATATATAPGGSNPHAAGAGATLNPLPLQSHPQRPAGRPAPPKLRLATPMGGSQDVTPSEALPNHNGKPVLPPLATGADVSERSRSGSRPGSAASSNYSALSFAMGLRQPPGNTPDPTSAISSVYSDRDALDQDAGVNGLLPDLDKLSLEKGRALDVEDLDDEGWLAASEQKKIVELGSLGEGAGGAVTRCVLKEGKTVFALKVGKYIYIYIYLLLTDVYRLSLPIQTPTSKSRLSESSTSTRTVRQNIFVAITARLWINLPVQFRLSWSSAKVAV